MPGRRCPGTRTRSCSRPPSCCHCACVNIAWIAARFAIVLWTSAIALVAIRTTKRIDDAASDECDRRRRRRHDDRGAGRRACSSPHCSRRACCGAGRSPRTPAGCVVAGRASIARPASGSTRRSGWRWPRSRSCASRSPASSIRCRRSPRSCSPSCLYCPYSMLHRIFKTLTRVRPDGAIRAAYLLDLAGFGIIWWRLTDWPDPITPDDSGTRRRDGVGGHRVVGPAADLGGDHGQPRPPGDRRPALPDPGARDPSRPGSGAPARPEEGVGARPHQHRRCRDPRCRPRR